MELDHSDEPAWAYLEYQHAHILATMKSIHSKSVDKAKGEKNLACITSGVSR